MPTRIAMQTAARAGAMKMLTDCAAASGVKLQAYRARPTSLFPPTGFIDSIGETLEWFAGTNFQRNPVVRVVLVWGDFDSGEAVDQRDAFVDAFIAWVSENVHAFNGNSLVDPVAIEDLPAWVPEWQPPAIQRTYYATQINLRGFAAT